MRSMSFLFVVFSWSMMVLPGPAQKPKWPPSPHVAPTDPLPPEEQRKKFHLPPGFEIQLVAAEPDINKPININFDARGRLWVTGSVEYPFAAKGKARDKVWILENFSPTGKAQDITTFAEGLNIPIGVLPISKGAIVFSIPSIYHITDSRGNGRGDQKKVLFTDYGFKDTHGMTGEFMWGFDGWIYACHGFANTSKVIKGEGGKVQIEMHSGNTYRFKPDGSRIEYFTHGQVNPFGLAFDEAGNLYSCDCHSRPIYQLLKGAWYPSFQKPHDGLGFGPEMLTHSHGSTAIAGIAYVGGGDHFPEPFAGNLFIGNVVTNRINRDRIEWHGSSPRAIEMPDFVKCDDPWFRPVDIKLGPDGALYVADFYNRIIGHYEVPLDHPGRDREKGRIWRIVYRGPKGEISPRKMEDLTRLSVPELVERLRQPNLTVRMHAMNLLAERSGGDVVKEINTLLDQNTEYPHALGLWVLERLGQLEEHRLARALKNKANLVRVHAMRILAERETWKSGNRDLALAGLRDVDPLVQRVAVEALGAHPQPEDLFSLLEFRFQVSAKDTHLMHTVRMALRNHLHLDESWNQLAGMKLGGKEVQAVADVCGGLRNQQSARFLLHNLERWPQGVTQQYAHHIARHGSREEGSKLLDVVFNKDPAFQATVYKAVLQGRQESGRTMDQGEIQGAEKLTRKLLQSDNAAHLQAGIELTGIYKLENLQPALLELIQNEKLAEGPRKNAVAALASFNSPKHLDALARILSDERQTLGLREQVAQSLAGTNLPQAHTTLAKVLETAPARLQYGIALALAGSNPGGEKLLGTIEAGKASARLLQEKSILVRLQQAKIAQLSERLKKLTRGLPPADQQMVEVLTKKRASYLTAKPDAAQGFQVFEKHCASCHQVANKGSKIAPQLDGIGIRGLDRILEDILDPSRNVDQAFRATTLVLKKGQLVTGLLLRQEGEIFIMADAQGKEVRIPKDTVEERTIAPLSPMPANFAEQIGAADFNHLLAFLLEQRAKN